MDWPELVPRPPILTPFESIGAAMGAGTSNTFTNPGANVAVFVPLYVEAPFVATKISLPLSAASGNYDVGIYDWAGERLVSSGAAAASSANMEADITDTLLVPGTYYFGVSFSSTNPGYYSDANTSGGIATAMGIYTMASAHPLPSTATFALAAGTVRIPEFAIIGVPL